MKHWILFTLRTMARVGLLGVVVSWWATQSVMMRTAIPAGAESIGVYVHDGGWSACVSNRAKGVQRWMFETIEIPDDYALAARFDASWPVVAGGVPGLDYRRPSIGWGHMLHFQHWAVGLIFLIGVLVTGRKPQRPAGDSSTAV